MIPPNLSISWSLLASAGDDPLISDSASSSSSSPSTRLSLSLTSSLLGESETAAAASSSSSAMTEAAAAAAAAAGLAASSSLPFASGDEPRRGRGVYLQLNQGKICTKFLSNKDRFEQCLFKF